MLLRRCITGAYLALQHSLPLGRHGLRLGVVRKRNGPTGAVRSASTCCALTYSRHGQPEDVVELQDDYPVADLGSEDVAVEMIMSPVNPSDVNSVQGVYAIRPPLPAVAGGEGVGVVTTTGAAVNSFKAGDWVVPAYAGMGTWRTALVDHMTRFVKVPNDMPVELAATLIVNPPTAYRMLKAFVTLKPGDCVIQNGANSGVGLSVIQLAAAWGLNTINIIRDRPNLEELKSYLVSLGANEVVTEEFARSYKMKELVQKYSSPALGFNCVGGDSATNLMKHLAPKSTMITYGGMSMKPVIISTGSLIFKDIRLRGYWNGKWLESNCFSEEHLDMMEELCELGRQGKLKAPPSTEYALRDYRAALARAMEPYIGSKQMLRFKEN